MHEPRIPLRRRGADDRGFTMIELLVVVVIIGILVAIAVPVYLNYRKGAANKTAQSDVRGAITAIEQYYTENANTYPADVAETGPPSAAIGTQSISISPGNRLQYDLLADGLSYKICATNTDGGAYYGYDSTEGGSVKKVTAANLAACLAAA